jgi:ATP-dependent protease HslVU (ClpYQ) peptidase subunit
MTAIVGVIDHSGEVWMGGDSAACDGYDLYLRKNPKVFQVGPFLIGCCGSARSLDVMRYGEGGKDFADKTLLYGCEESDPHAIMVTKFVPSMREKLKAAGSAAKSHEQEHIHGGILVGFRGRLFMVASDYQVHENSLPYIAVGCGAAYAMGSMHTTHMKLGEVEATRMIHWALAAAEEFSAGVRAPFTVLRLEESKP